MNRIIRFLSFMIMIFVSIDISGQEKNIVSGEVCNKHGEPLTGANVYIYMLLSMGICLTLLVISPSRHLLMER